ncbi:MAG: hypothetical protein ABSC50_00860 [Candidatus Bathyarchaeia archaeon]
MKHKGENKKNQIFVGIADIANRDSRVRNPAYRKRMYESAYRFDFAKYGGELSLHQANQIVAEQKRVITTFLSPDFQNKTVGTLQGRDLILSFNSTRKEKSADFQYELIPKNSLLDVFVSDARELGRFAQYLYQEMLPKVRLWIHWHEYVIGGVPDGVGDDYAYEFKVTTQANIEKQKDVAWRQAQLYAYMFRRPKIRTQIAKFNVPGFPVKIRDLPNSIITIIDAPASEHDAQVILTEFDNAFRKLWSLSKPEQAELNRRVA